MITQKIRKYIGEYLDIWPFSGVIFVVQRGEIIFQQSYGMACYEFAVANTINTCFSLASVSKQFTAFAVMQLFDQGMIDIEAPVNNYLPDNLKIDRCITSHHLLSHTSGLPDYYSFECDFFQEYDRLTYSKQDFFDRYVNRPLNCEPGSKYEYSNAGYNMLAWLVEEVSGERFADYLQRHIFKPLDMGNTVLYEDSNIIKNKAFLYTMDRDDLVRSLYYNDKFSLGAGGVVSNCQDLYKWYRCLKDRRILSNEIYELFFREKLNGYCYGLSRDIYNNRVRYYHGGDHLGILSCVQYYFDDDICIIILANNDSNNQYSLGRIISDVIFSADPQIPQSLPKIILDEELARRYEGTYLERKIELRRHKGNWEFVRFNGNLHIAVYPVGNHQFACKWRDQIKPYTLIEGDDGVFEFFGFKRL